MLWRQPETRLVFIGNMQDLNMFLNYSYNALRNTRHAVYVALPLNYPSAAGTGKDARTYKMTFSSLLMEI